MGEGVGGRDGRAVGGVVLYAAPRMVSWGSGRRGRRASALAISTICCAGLALATTDAGAMTVTLTRGTAGRVQPGFLGLSMEMRGVEAYSGYDAKAINPVFEQLIRELAPRQHPLLRLAGDSTDWSWYPVRNTRRPLGVRFTLTPRWFDVMRALARGVNGRLIIGVNLEVDRARVAAAEARAIIHRIGSPWLRALELGNEPDLYNMQTWFALHGKAYHGRGAGWGFQRYLGDYARIRRALPSYPLAGPDVAARVWVDGMGQFLSSQPGVRIATVHRYPLGCIPTKRATIPSLFSEVSTRGYTAGLAGAVAAAHARGASIRLDEMNTVSCGGQHGVSNTFAAALWSLDAQFEVARTGMDGVNVHTSQSTANELFNFGRTRGRWRGHVHPELYGMLAFARAAPGGSRLLRVTGSGSGPVHVWATQAPGGIRRVVLINLSLRAGRNVEVRVRAARRAATLVRLLAPNPGATGHVTLAGQSFGMRTTTGRLRGRLRRVAIAPARGAYGVWLPPASAAILTLPRG